MPLLLNLSSRGNAITIKSEKSMTEDYKTGLDFKSTNLDIFLAIITTVGLPFLCMKLFEMTGALLPILVYYLVFCVGLVKWRKGSLDYCRPQGIVSLIFIALLLLQLILFYVSTKIIIPVKNFSLAGFFTNILIWCPANAFSEQLLWIYIYDAFAKRFEEKRLKIIFSGMGIIFYFAFIGLIHAFFWGEFMMGFQHTDPYWQLFIGIHFSITIGYLMIYRKTKSMYPVAILHLIGDIGCVLGAGYSILPYLLK